MKNSKIEDEELIIQQMEQLEQENEKLKKQLARKTEETNKMIVECAKTKQMM